MNAEQYHWSQYETQKAKQTGRLMELKDKEDQAEELRMAAQTALQKRKGKKGSSKNMTAALRCST